MSHRPIRTRGPHRCANAGRLYTALRFRVNEGETDRDSTSSDAFYTTLFGWTTKLSDNIQGEAAYTEFQVDGESIAGAMEMNPQMPAEIPSYWMVYVDVSDVDGAYQKALGLGATEMMAPQQYPGGRFAILRDPQGASFGLLRSER